MILKYKKKGIFSLVGTWNNKYLMVELQYRSFILMEHTMKNKFIIKSFHLVKKNKQTLHQTLFSYKNTNQNSS